LYNQQIYYNADPPRDPTVQSWSLEVQRELPGNTLLKVGYAGAHGTHLSGPNPVQYNTVAQDQQYMTQLSTSVPITNYYSGNTAAALEQIYGSTTLPLGQLLRQYPAYAIGAEAGYNGSNIYHALNVSINKKYSNGLDFVIAYTWSKTMSTADTGSMEQFIVDPIHGAFQNGGRAGFECPICSGPQGTGYENPQKEDVKILSMQDVPQMFNVAFAYQLPFGKGRAFLNQGRVVSGVLGGWKVSGNFNAASGIPLPIRGPCSALQSALGVSCLPNLVGNPKAVPGGRSAADWINPAAFDPAIGSDQTFWTNYTTTDPRAWVLGNATSRGPGGIFSPGFWNLDTSLSKNFVLREGLNMEFRWEMFNALNHQNLGMPNMSYCLPPTASGETDIVHQAGCGFGLITNIATDPRSMEFGLKLTF
jgi:hypothetical protein